MYFQCCRICGRCFTISGQLKASSATVATTQRMNVRVSGETCPTIALPTTQLSDQKSDVRVSSR